MFCIAWGGALLVVAHAVVHGWVKSAVNGWYKDFYNLLESTGRLAANSTATDADWVGKQADVYDGLADFSRIAVVAVVVMPLAKWVRSVWSLRWRLALMHAYVGLWDANRAPIEGASQRVHEDSYKFSKGVELCLSTVLDSVITLGVFVPILIELGAGTRCPRSLAAFAFLGDGWLVGLAFSSAIVGLVVTMLLGHRLVRLEVENQVVEAKLRRDLVVLETMPGKVCSVNFLHDADAASVDTADTTDESMGDAVTVGVFASPLAHFVPIVDAVRINYDRLFLNFTVLNLWLAVFEQFNTILPYLVFAPLLFSPNADDRIMLGVLVQVSNAFGRVFDSLNVIADNWAGINELRSVLVRLGQFELNLYHEHPHPSRRLSAWPLMRLRSTTRVSAAAFGVPSDGIEVSRA